MMTLKPCPFCGGSSAMYYQRESSKRGPHGYMCVRCLAIGPVREMPECEDVSVLTLWNTRPIEDQLRRELEEARVAYGWATSPHASPEQVEEGEVRLAAILSEHGKEEE